MKFFELWNRQLARVSEERFYLAMIGTMAVVVAAVLTVLGLALQRNFLLIACDMAAFQNTLVNTLHGNWFRDTAYDGPNLLGLHATFVLLLIAPIYAVFPSPDTLFTLQIWSVYSTVIPLYLIACDILRRPLMAFLIAATALVSPLFFLQMAFAPFHPETWILAAVFWSFFFYRRNWMIAFWISLVFALSCSEHAALDLLATLALGTRYTLRNAYPEDGVAWRKRYGVFAVVAGLGWLIFTMGILTPLMRHPDQRNLFAFNYADWAIIHADASDSRIRSAPDLAIALPQDPLQVVMKVFNPSRWVHLISFVGIPLLLALLSRRTLILLAPFPVYFLMNDREFFLYFHAYYFQFAFFSGYLAFITFVSRWNSSTHLGVAVISATFLLNVVILCAWTGFYVGFYMEHNEPLNKEIHAAFDKIPSGAAVYSPHRYSAYLSNRPNMVMGDLADEKLDFKAMLDARYGTTNVHPEQIDYIVCDIQNDQCGWRQGTGSSHPEISERRAANIKQLVDSGHWQFAWTEKDVVILHRINKP